MTLPRYRLRLLIPGIVFTVTLLLILVLTLDRIREGKQAIIGSLTETAHTQMTQLQDLLSDSLMRGEQGQAAQRLSYAALSPQVAAVALVGADHRVLIASRQEWVNGDAAAIPHYDGERAGKAISLHHGTLYPGTTDHLHGYYPVTLGMRAGEIRPQQSGILFVGYDFSGQVDHLRHEAYKSAAKLSAALLVFALLLSFLLHLLITRPIDRLLGVVKEIKDGNLSARAMAPGTDELGRLARSFDEMADELARNQERLHDQNIQLEEEIAERQVAQEALQEQAFQLEEEIGERQTAQEALQEQAYQLEEEIAEHRQTEDKLRIIFDAAQAGIVMVGANGVITFANRCASRLYGFEGEEMAGSRYEDHVHPDERPVSDELLDKLVRGEIDAIAEKRHYLKRDGGDFWGFLNAKRHLGDDGSLLALIIVITDITELRNAQFQMGLNFQRLESLVRILQYRCDSVQGFLDYALEEALGLTASRFGAIFVYDEARRELIHTAWSRDAAAACGATGQRVPSALGEAGLWGEALRQRQPVIVNSYEHPDPLKKGGPAGQIPLERLLSVPVFGGQEIAAVVCVANKAGDYDQADVLHLRVLLDSAWKICRQMKGEQEREALQTKFNQAQKMEAVGRLAGGVAHDINNKLSIIMGYADLLKLQPNSLSQDQTHYLEEMQKAANHSCEIVRQLLAFSRSDVISPRTVNINAIIADARKSLGRLIGEDIRFEFRPAEDIWPALLDPTQIDQIIMNLAVNARDAMPDGGLFSIETGNASLDEAACQGIAPARAGDYVRLSVGDTGCGMDAETLGHIFEPFFTTKEVGKGTGLGLATIFGIVSRNKGFITVSSEVGFGTTFNIFFPRMAQEGAAAEPREDERRVAPGSGTVLLVEDEEALCDLAAKMLGTLGYRAVIAKSPGEAIELCAGRDLGDIDLVLTDIIMPGMNGKEMCDRIRELRPGTPALFMSGYTADVISAKGIPEASLHYLQKPFNLLKLSQMIRKAMG
ncbi:GAF domain-containing protein [Oryzomonas sagensis]|uniref:histidine kinase n=1 Tax=Oryzomonas sagensis TaxID=2603857 RepID=A0ABQ6TNZ6_9BACT|nr:GAF domain-containing protein [Oryzomonas sagensis]KAB0670314.1 GAF domain-containing protein [Oryzomonas sagensis]